MVKEIVPFPEILAAVIMIAFEYFNESLWLRVFESEYPKFLSLRNMLLNLNWLQIKGVSWLHMYIDLIRNTIKGIALVFELWYLSLVFVVIFFFIGYCEMRSEWLVFLSSVIFLINIWLGTLSWRAHYHSFIHWRKRFCNTFLFVAL